MDILLIILGILCLLTGLAGCFLPVLPGPPVSYAGLLLLHFTDKIHFSTTPPKKYRDIIYRSSYV